MDQFHMQKILPIFLLIATLISACSPAVGISTPTSAQVNSYDNFTSVTVTPSPTTSISPTLTSNPKNAESTSLPTSASTDFIATEILGQPTSTSITINVVPAVEMELHYEYGTSSGIYSSQTSSQNAEAGVPLETRIDGLQPNTKYYFHIAYNGKVGTEHSFITQRAPGSTFVFDLQGDSHPERTGKEFNADLYTRTLQSAASDHPDFYITMGDDFSVDTLKTVNADTVKALYLNQRQWLGLVGAPVFLINGNHEQASMVNLNGTANNVAVWAQTARNAYYPEPIPDGFYTGDAQQVQYIGYLRDYYAWTWGEALFVVIDPYWHSPVVVDNPFGGEKGQKGKRDQWNITLGDEQYQWFKNVLETSTAKYKFVFTHHVLGTGRGGIEEATAFEWGDAANLSAHHPGWEATIQQLMSENHVTIFFQGHDHIFAHQELDGVIYQTLPEPADPNYSLFNSAAYKSGDMLPNSGHVRVTVSPNGVEVDYIRSFLDKPDEIAFSYQVP